MRAECGLCNQMKVRFLAKTLKTVMTVMTVMTEATPCSLLSLVLISLSNLKKKKNSFSPSNYFVVVVFKIIFVSCSVVLAGARRGHQILWS